MDDDQGFFANLQLDDDDPQTLLRGLLSPVSAQVVEGAPPTTPAISGPGQSTPRTGNLATAPQQAQPRVSGPAMLPGIATKPENLQPASTTIAPQARLLQVSSAGNGLRSGSTPIAIRDANGNPVRSYSDLTSPATSTPTAISLGQSAGTPSRQRWQRIVSNPSGGLAGTFAAQQQAYAARQPGLAPAMPTSLASIPGYRSRMPALPATASTVAPPAQQRLAQDQAALTRYQQTGPGVNQIKNRLGRDIAKGADVAASILIPGWAPAIPGTTAHNARLQALEEGQIANDQQQMAQAASLADTQSQTAYRDAQARQQDARANYYNPAPLTPEQAASIGSPTLAGTPMDQRDFARLQEAYGKNQASLQTHTGGQSRTLSAADAAAIDMPSLAGVSMSNDEYQRTLQQRQRNQQSGANNAANNAARVTTTRMRDQTSSGNSDRAHAGKSGGAGTPKPIPAGVRDRIESEKSTALAKARADLDSGASSMDEYKNTWQAIQDAYEERISAQTGAPVPHVDIRKNTDPNGNWIGKTQPAQPQAQRPANRPAFITRKGTTVSVGDPVNVNGKKGTVTGFNPTTGKAQVKWEAAQ